MEKLCGVRHEDVMGRMLTGDVFGGLLRLKRPDGLTRFMIVLNNAMDGHDTDQFPFSFLDRQVGALAAGFSRFRGLEAS